MKNNPIIQGRWYKINKKVKKRIKAKYHKIKYSKTKSWKLKKIEWAEVDNISGVKKEDKSQASLQ